MGYLMSIWKKLGKIEKHQDSVCGLREMEAQTINQLKSYPRQENKTN